MWCYEQCVCCNGVQTSEGLASLSAYVTRVRLTEQPQHVETANDGS